MGHYSAYAGGFWCLQKLHLTLVLLPQVRRLVKVGKQSMEALTANVWCWISYHIWVVFKHFYMRYGDSYEYSKKVLITVYVSANKYTKNNNNELASPNAVWDQRPLVSVAVNSPNHGNVYLYNPCVISLRLLMCKNIVYTLIPWWVTMGGDVMSFEDR